MAITVEMRRGEATRVVASLDEFRAVVDDPKLERDVAEIRRLQGAAAQKKLIGKDADAAGLLKEADKIKSALPGFIFQCREFDVHNWTDKKGVDHGDAAWRHQAFGRLNGLFMVDFDHIENPTELWLEIQKKGKLDKWKVCLAFITSSAKGLKVVCVADEKVGNLAANQEAFCEGLSEEYDKSCKDASRLSFAPSMKDILFINGDFLTFGNPAFVDKWEGKYADGSADQDLFKGKGKPEGSPESQPADNPMEAMCKDWEDRIRRGENLSYDDYSQKRTYQGVKILDFINIYLGEKQPGEGERHDSLLHLACDLRYVLDNDIVDIAYYLYREPFVQDLVKIGRDVIGTIKDGYGYQYYKNKPKKVRQILEFLSSPSQQGGSEIEAMVRASMTAFGEEIQKYFKLYPCLKECCGAFEPVSYPALLFVGGALFGTLATRTWYYFYHDPEAMRRLNYEIFIIADPANSKSSIGSLYKKILAPIIAADEVYDQQINAYKIARKNFDVMTKKDRDKSEVVYPTSRTRIHGTRTANNIFIEDMVNNYEEVDGMRIYKHLFTFDSELDSATAAAKGGQWIDKTIWELKAFHNEEDNQQYRNIDSYTGKFNVYWNFIYTGTPFSLHKKVNQRNFGSGLYGRLAVMPLMADKYKMIPRLRRNQQIMKQTDTLKEWAYKMDSVCGELPIDSLVDVTWEWTNDIMQMSEAMQNDVTSNLCRRVPYYGLHIAVPFIIMRHWKHWEEKKELPIDDYDKDFVRLVMEIQFYTQKLYFGKYAENYFKERSEDYKETAVSKESDELKMLLAKLPDKFKTKDVQDILKYKKSWAYRFVNKLVSEGLVTTSTVHKLNPVFEKVSKNEKKEK